MTNSEMAFDKNLASVVGLFLKIDEDSAAVGRANHEHVFHVSDASSKEKRNS